MRSLLLVPSPKGRPVGLRRGGGLHSALTCGHHGATATGRGLGRGRRTGDRVNIPGNRPYSDVFDSLATSTPSDLPPRSAPLALVP